MKYFLADKKEHPEFEYILLTGEDYTKYFLYRADEFDDAYNQLRNEISEGRHIAVLCGLDFNTKTREWRAQPLFRRSRGSNKITYDPYQSVMLHIKWYCDAGKWENPRENWN